MDLQKVQKDVQLVTLDGTPEKEDSAGTGTASAGAEESQASTATAATAATSEQHEQQGEQPKEVHQAQHLEKTGLDLEEQTPRRGGRSPSWAEE